MSLVTSAAASNEDFRTRSLAWLMALLAIGPAFGADATKHTGPRGAPLPLEPVYRVKPAEGKRPFTTRTEFDFKKLQLDGVAFLAVCTNEWPTGLVPVFAVEKTNRIELRRRPVRGLENTSEPLFFALPPEDEPDASKLAGRWECEAIRGNGTKDYLAWELAIEEGAVSGRFDQDTQYRYAYVMGGTFRSNRMELRVEYMTDAYVLKGDWQDGKLRGEWRHVEDRERGTWEAARKEKRFAAKPDLFPTPPERGVASKEVIPLYEWRRVADDARHYAVEGERMESGWERSPRPLCRVWRATATRGN